MEAVIFVPDDRVWRRRGAPGGLALLERQLRQLRDLGIAAVTLVVATDAPPRETRAPAHDVRRVAPTDDPFVAVAAAGPLPSDFLFLAADYVVDLRVLRALVGAPVETLLVVDDAPAPIGRLSRQAVERYGADVATAARPLRLDTLDPYAPELRGPVAPYAVRARDAAGRRTAWRALLDGVQKRGLDFPGEYFDSPFENVLVRALAPTRITPNQITLATLVVAAVVAALFLRGALVLGTGLALVVGVLDGVDGKLARLKLATSRLGELEHVGDFLYENFWWAALALYFADATGLVAFHRVGIAVVACDFLDNLVYGFVQKRTGRLLDELSRFDRGFRRVGGRRNVYVWILIAGVATGHAAGGYVAMAIWAAVTLVVHAARAVWWTATLGAPLPDVGASIRSR